MNRDAAADKVRKCLKLAASNEPHEAAAALRQAQALMRRHALSEEDVEMARVRCERSKRRSAARPPRWQALLARLVGDAFGAIPVHGRGGVRWISVGERAALASYAFDVLLRQLREGRLRHMKTLRRCKPANRRRRADLYSEAWVHAARRTVVEFSMSSADRALIESWMRSNLPTRAVRHRGPGDLDDRDWRALAAGALAGSEAALLHPVEGSPLARLIDADA